MRRSLRQSLVSLFTLCVVLPSGWAAEAQWIGAFTGSWDNMANWFPAAVPGEEDTVVFGAAPAENKYVTLPESSTSLLGLSFLEAGFFLEGLESSTITLTTGALSSQGSDSMNVIALPVALTAATNTITVGGDSTHELDLDDLSVTGVLITNVNSSLCLGGVTTVTGAFVKSGTGVTCTAGGLTAASTSVQEGIFEVEGNSSLGTTVISAAGSLVTMFSATTTAQSVSVSGVLAVGLYPGADDKLIATEGVAVEHGGGLSGFGIVEGDVIVKSGGKVAPGGIFGEGELTLTSNTEFQAGSIASFTIMEENLLQGSVVVNGNLTLNGRLSLNDSGALGLYTLFTFTGDFLGGFTGIEDAADGFAYDLIYLPNAVQLSVTAIPEPSVLGLMGVAAVSVGWVWRRRREVV